MLQRGDLSSETDSFQPFLGWCQPSISLNLQPSRIAFHSTVTRDPIDWRTAQFTRIFLHHDGCRFNTPGSPKIFSRASREFRTRAGNTPVVHTPGILISCMWVVPTRWNSLGLTLLLVGLLAPLIRPINVPRIHVSWCLSVETSFRGSLSLVSVHLYLFRCVLPCPWFPCIFIFFPCQWHRC